MGIDKILPGKLNTDTEERLLQQGNMSDAMNITISEDGEGTASIAKNIIGTIPGDALSNTDEILNNRRIVAIGSASDSQRGFIYYIVADANSGVPLSQSQHAIYQYNVTNDTYRLVLKDGRFRFNPDSFVKLDVVNADFARNGGLQTVLFFTDNINPPRKVNVDRAIAGDYSDLTANEFEYSLNCIKAPNVYEPKASFTTDKTIDTNLFRDEAFQFATQIIYKDGEESAISPYSKLTIPTQLTAYNVQESGYGLGYNVDNVCVIDPNLSADDLLSSPDVSKLRILFRSGNIGAFNIADEVPLNVTTSRLINGSSVTIFNGSTNFRFYNDRVVTPVAPSEVNKLFDNVPFEAKGQAVSGNRLMYSNYTEGRENTDISATLSVNYRSANVAREELVDQTDSDLNGVPDVIEAGISAPFGVTNISFNIPEMMGVDAADAETTIIQAGTSVNFSFYWSALPLATLIGDPSSPLMVIDTIDLDGFNDPAGPPIEISSVSFAQSENNPTAPLVPEIESTTIDSESTIEEILPKFDISFTVPEDMPLYAEGVTNFIDTFRNFLEVSTFAPKYELRFNGTVGDEELVDYQFFQFAGLTPDKKHPRLVIGFDPQPVGAFLDFTANAVPKGIYFEDPVLTVNPMTGGEALGGLSLKIESNQVSDFEVDQQQLTIGGSVNVFTGQDPVIQVFSSNYLVDTKLSITETNQVSGFKAGALHNFGVVYYDKFNRSGFVNELGNVYVEWFNKDGSNFRGNKADPINYLAGPAEVEVKINSAPPEWAETYQIVYPGNSSVSDFVQYTVGGAFPARVKHATDQGNSLVPNRDIDTESKRLYISLETLDQYRSERNTFRDYSFTEGDKLRVISLKNEIGDSISLDTDEDDLESIYKGASDGTIIEFDVVGVELLAKDLDNPISHSPTGTVINNITTDTEDYFTGKFLVIEASSIASGAVGEDGEILKYPGFDWNHVSAYYSGTTATQDSGEANSQDFEYLSAGNNVPTAVNSWRQRGLVEIFTPKLSTANEFYYEIGEKKNIGRFGKPQDPINHGPKFTLDSGDINYRPVPCKTLFFDEDATVLGNVFKSDFKDFVYRLETLESFTVSDKLGENMWNQGRPHVKYDNAATFRRFNGVTYSDAYAEDVDRLSLSSFNATLANFYSFDSQYGACNYISNYGTEQRGFDELVGIQENKFSKTPVNKSILLDGSGANNVALSTNVLNSTTYYAGDYGCGNHPESVLVQDNDVYFFDRSRKKVLRFSGNQLNPISDAGVSSTVNDATDAFNRVFDRQSGRIVSGYDPDDNVYYITFHYPQALSYHSEEINTLVPLYLTTDFNQDGTVTGEDSVAFMDVFNQIGTGEITEAEAAEILDVSFQALDPDNPSVLTLSSAATFDVTNNAGTGNDGLVTTADLLEAITQLGVPSPVNSIIDGVTYIQYVNMYDADGNPIPVMANGQPVFIDVTTNEIVFADGSPVNGEATEGEAVIGSEIDIPFNPEYNSFITLSYNAEGNFWQSKISYYPDIYANQDNKMYTAKYVIDSATPPPSVEGNALMFHRHEDLKTEGNTILNRCTFYNQPTSESFIEIVSNANPSGVKVYDALSYEGDSAAFKASVESFLGNKKGMSNVGRLDFVNKEGSYYSSIGGDVSENSTNHIRPVGFVVGVEGLQIIINDAPAGAIAGAVLKTVSDQGVLSDIGAIPEEEITIKGGMSAVSNGVSIEVSGEVDPSIVGTAVVMELPRERDGDSIRGHYAKIKLSTEEGENVGKYELFCVNAHVTQSDLHHVN